MCSDAADRWRQHAQTSGSASHGFRVYKYVLVGKHADDDDKSFLLKSHLKLIVLESWPSFVTDFDVFHQTFFWSLIFSMPLLKEKLDFAICYDLRNMRLHPFFETQVILKGCFIF